MQPPLAATTLSVCTVLLFARVAERDGNAMGREASTIVFFVLFSVFGVFSHCRYTQQRAELCRCPNVDAHMVLQLQNSHNGFWFFFNLSMQNMFILILFFGSIQFLEVVQSIIKHTH